LEKLDGLFSTWQDATPLEPIQTCSDMKQPRSQSTPFKVFQGKANPIGINRLGESRETLLAVVGIQPLSILEKLWLRLGGTISLGKLHPQGPKSTKFFLRYCTNHGIILAYPQGYDGFLRCGQCTKQPDACSIWLLAIDCTNNPDKTSKLWLWPKKRGNLTGMHSLQTIARAPYVSAKTWLMLIPLWKNTATKHRYSGSFMASANTETV